MIDECVFGARRVLTDDKSYGAVGIDVIGSILRVVFDYEDGSVVPVRTVRDGIDDAAECKVVIGDRGLRSGLSGTRASSVVVGQIEKRELRKFFGASLSFNELIEFAQEFIGAELIRIVDIEVRKLRIVMIALGGFGGARALHGRDRPRPGTWPAPWIADICRQRISFFYFGNRADCGTWRQGAFFRGSRFP